MTSSPWVLSKVVCVCVCLICQRRCVIYRIRTTRLKKKPVLTVLFFLTVDMVGSDNTHYFNKPSATVFTIFNWFPIMTGLFPPFHTGSRWNRHSVMGSGRINPDRLESQRRRPPKATALASYSLHIWTKESCELGSGSQNKADGGSLCSKELHRRVLSRRGENYPLASFRPSDCEASVVDVSASGPYFLRKIEHSKGLKWN